MKSVQDTPPVRKNITLHTVKLPWMDTTYCTKYLLSFLFAGTASWSL
jgi:hypothetical protein